MLNKVVQCIEIISSNFLSFNCLYYLLHLVRSFLVTCTETTFYFSFNLVINFLCFNTVFPLNVHATVFYLDVLKSTTLLGSCLSLTVFYFYRQYKKDSQDGDFNS